MVKVEIKYVKTYEDRHGVRRCYFRKPGMKSIALKGEPGSPEFMEAYRNALEGRTAPKRQVGAENTKAGTVSALLVAYYGSADFLNLQLSTKRGYKCVLEPFRVEHGHRLVKDITPKAIMAVLDTMAKRPGSANNLRKRLRSVLQFAVEREWRNDNPVLSVKKPKSKSEGFIPWSEDEIAQYEERWASGTKERLALALFLFTGQRRGDVVRMGRQHIRGGRISVVQQKTGTRLEIRILPALQREIDQAGNNLTFLMTEQGKPFTKEGFGNWFKDRVVGAGIQNRAAHGLRKASARRLAEAGCTAHQIASVTGHKSLSEIERYTRDASQLRLGDEAADALLKAEGRTSSV